MDIRYPDTRACEIRALVTPVPYRYRWWRDRWLMLAMAVIAAFFLTVAAKAETLPPEHPVYGKLRAMLPWLATHTEYDTDVPLPKVVVLTHDAIQARWYGQAVRDGPRVDIFMIYDRREETIYASERYDVTKPENDAFLAHELGHHLQKRAGKTWPCLAASEPEAYRLQAQWVAETGVGYVPSPDIIAMFSACPGHT